MPSEPDTSEPPLRFTSYGKLLLFGEHAAVYGYPALGVNLDCSLSLEVYPRDHAGDAGHFPGLSPREARAAGELLVTASALVPELLLPPAQYRLQGDVPRSSGFGSSATVCVNLAGYVLHLAREQHLDLNHLLPKYQHSSQWPEDEKNQYLLWYIANHLEKVFHGSPSGIDTGLAALGGVRAFFPRSRKLPDSMRLESAKPGIWLLYGSVPREGNTKTLVGDLQRGMLEENPKVVSAMEDLGELAHSAIDVFQNGESDGGTQTEALGALARKAHDRLSELNLNTSDMDLVLDKSRKLGSPGGKLSGAGGGGAFYILCNGEEAAREMREQLTAYCGHKNIELSHPLSLLRI
jgi:mevalonate kinase